MKNTNHLVILVLVAAILGLLAACGSARRSEPFRGPLPADNAVAARGQVVFSNYCQSCHPGGETGIGPSINNKPLPGFMIRRQVRKGLGAMPAFKEEVISEKDMDALIEYLDVLQNHTQTQVNSTSKFKQKR